MNILQTSILNLIRSSVCDVSLLPEDIADLTEENLKKIYKISCRHDVAHLVADGLQKNGLGQDFDIGKQFFERQMLAVFRTEQIGYELARVSELFEENGIDFIPLKGSVLRGYYPQDWMRTSCDIDVLIKRDDLNKATALLTDTFGYTPKPTQDSQAYDLSFFSPTGIHLELHYGLMEKMFSGSRYLSQVWDEVVLKEGKRHHFVMPDDMFYFYQIAHLAKHFKSSGCGIRLFLDIWVLRHHKDFRITENSYRYLEDVGLLNFEKAVTKLAEAWFSDGEVDENLEKMQDYIFGSGIYGTSENHLTSRQIDLGGKKNYALSRIFLPLDKLVMGYPVLKKHPYLLPFFEVKRWFDIIKAGRLASSVDELNANNAVKDDKVSAVRELFDSLDLI